MFLCKINIYLSIEIYITRTHRRRESMERTFSIVVSQKTIIIKKECLFLNKHTLAVQCARGRQYFKMDFTFPWKTLSHLHKKNNVTKPTQNFKRPSPHMLLLLLLRELNGNCFSHAGMLIMLSKPSQLRFSHFPVTWHIHAAKQ